MQSLGRENLSSPWNYRTLPLTGRICGSSPITVRRTPAGRGYKAFHKARSLQLIMPSILNTPANKIPLHLFHLPIAQREVLLVNVLTDPILYEQVISSALYHDDPAFTQAIIIFRNYVLIRQLFSCLAVPCLPVQITEAFDPTLSTACTAILVLLVDRGLDRLLGTLPRDHLALILRTIILSLVTVMGAPTSFSLFSLTDCTLYSHFSFDDFVMRAFPDLTRDLDNPI